MTIGESMLEKKMSLVMQRKKRYGALLLYMLMEILGSGPSPQNAEEPLGAWGKMRGYTLPFK